MGGGFVFRINRNSCQTIFIVFPQSHHKPSNNQIQKKTNPIQFISPSQNIKIIKCLYNQILLFYIPIIIILTMSMIVKIANDKEIHLFRGEIDFTVLKRHCQNVFKVIPKNFQFYYFDTDGDKITVNSQQDLEIIMESSVKEVIKKIYIQETDNEFQVLQDKGNPEECEQLSPQVFCRLPQYDYNIKTVNIVKDQISRQEEQKIKRQTKMYLNELQEQIIDKLIRDQEKLVQQQVAKFLCLQLEKRVTAKAIEEEERMIREGVSQFMDQMMQNCTRKLIKQTPKIPKVQRKELGVQNQQMSIMDSKLNKNEILINRIVDEKINKILPGIVKQVVRAVEARMKINGCCSCYHKQPEAQLCDTIKSSLMKKMKRSYYEY